RAVSAKLGELSTRPHVTALNVGFLQAPVADLEHHLSAYRSDIDDFIVDGCELYWLCAVKQSQSEFEPGKLEKKLKLQMGGSVPGDRATPQPRPQESPTSSRFPAQ
ncbi:MAG: hypothetical protein MUE46_20380, partial [Xanthomonadales bacterium]|nr:hypothetical protein [Xanthomonadales bacterium]